MTIPNQDSTPGSVVLPVDAMSNPAAAVAWFLGLEQEDISVVSMENISKEEVKIRFYIV